MRAALEVLFVTRMNVNRNRLLVLLLLDLRKHFNKCGKCRAARTTRDFDSLCEWSKGMLVEVAVKWDSNIAGRLAARKSADQHCFPCPNPNAHGEAYAATAEPVVVTGRQGSIF